MVNMFNRYSLKMFKSTNYFFFFTIQEAFNFIHWEGRNDLSNHLLIQTFLEGVQSSENHKKERGDWAWGREKKERVTSSLLHLQSLIHVSILKARKGYGRVVS